MLIKHAREFLDPRSLPNIKTSFLSIFFLSKIGADIRSFSVILSKLKSGQTIGLLGKGRHVVDFFGFHSEFFLDFFLPILNFFF